MFLHEELAVHLVSGVFDEQLVLLPGEDDADGRIVAFGILLFGEVAEIQVHLADVVMLHVVELQVDQHEATEDAVVADKVDSKDRVDQFDGLGLPSR